MGRRCTAVAVALGVAVTASAAAHVAPSVDDNNRYIKLTPLGDRVRLAYTIFYGEVPGAQLRPALDTNRDGALDAAEGEAYGTKLAAEVAAALEITVDGTAQPVAWAQVSVGMGTPRVAAGAFSVDLVTYLCLPSPRGTHQVVLRDRLRLLRPGETEVKIEDSPGVKLVHARIGQRSDPTLSFRMVGPGGPLSDDGLDLVFDASDQAPIASVAACAAAASKPRATPTGVIVGAVAVIGAALGAVVVMVRRRRRPAS